MTTTQHVGIYARVSSRRQKEASQLPDLKRWEAASGDVCRWYHDKFTGRCMERPGWKSLWRDIEAGKVSKIVVWRLDRLGRTNLELVNLFAELDQRGVNMISLHEYVDATTPFGRMCRNFLASLAEYDNEVRMDRVLAGQEIARQAGKSWGGWQKGKRRKVSPDQVRIIRQMKAAGERIAAIARATGLSRPSIYAVLEAVL